MASYNGHDYVEIAGTKWATMNIGASSVTDYGQYFQWGDTTGYLSSDVEYWTNPYKKPFDWRDYKFDKATNGNDRQLLKYNSSDKNVVLDLCDDAALANWGEGWRMPTTAELQALGGAVNTAWTGNYQGSGVAGLVCTDKTDSSKVLFFPAAGYFGTSSVSSVGSYGLYWSSSFYTDYTKYAYTLLFYNGTASWGEVNARIFGLPVRAVCDPDDYVDFGLPSGTLWAKRNIGAISETDYGNYYMYGKGADTYQVTSGQSDYSGTENPLALSADTAAQVLGGQWHMPTIAQCQELAGYCTWNWTTKNGINGYIVSRNGKYIFLPAGSAFIDGSLDHDSVGKYGFYYTSSPTNNNNDAWNFVFTPSEKGYMVANTRNLGLSVRPVIG